MRLNSQERSGQKLTQRAEIAIVRRFREYPDRFVGKPQRTEGRRKAHAIPIPMPVSKQDKEFCAILDTRDSPQYISDHCFPRSEYVVTLRPIAIVPATPSTLEGLCGPGQRNGVGSSFESGKTLDHRRLFTSGLLYRFTDATAGKIFGHEALQRPHSFCVYGKKSRDLSACLAKFGCKVLRVN